jgi:ribosomal protein S27E
MRTRTTQLVSVRCPECKTNQVWSASKNRWQCPNCEWTLGEKRERDEQIAAACERAREAS